MVMFTPVDSSEKQGAQHSILGNKYVSLTFAFMSVRVSETVITALDGRRFCSSYISVFKVYFRICLLMFDTCVFSSLLLLNYRACRFSCVDDRLGLMGPLIASLVDVWCFLFDWMLFEIVPSKGRL